MSSLANISGYASLGMFGFDYLAKGAAIWGKDNAFTAFNTKLHKSSVYNGIQLITGITALASGGFAKGMRNPTCFVAGTMVLTAAGLTAIEHIKAGDRVISANPETGEAAEKEVLETYVRETDRLVHLNVNGEEIITTADHPFYVDKLGFVNAGELWTGARLLDVKGDLLNIEDMRLELAGKPVTVYNFQVEEFHTYYAGAVSVLVHNADYPEDVKGMQEKPHGGTEQKPLEGGSRSVQGVTGRDFENYLNDTLGGDGSFCVGGREIDGGVGNRWWKAKSGNCWDML